MNALEVRAALTLALVYVLRMLGLFMVMPVLAIAAMDYTGYSPLMVGLAIGGYGLTQAALQIPMGMLSDRWGRKPVIIAGLLFFALGSLIAANATSMTWLVIGRVMQGAGAIAGAIMALATDVSRESQRAKVMAIIGIAIGFSFYIAVLLGPIVNEQWGLSGIFSITGIMALVCIPMVIWLVPNGEILSSGDTLPQKGQVRRLVLSSQLWRLNVSVLVLHMLITLLFVQLPITLLQFDMALDTHWTLYLPVLGLSIVGLVIMMGIARGRAPKGLLFSGVTFMASAFVMLALLGNGWWWVALAVVLFFTGFNFLEATFPALVSSIAPAGQKGTAMGIYASFQFFGAFLGGLVSGWVTDIWTSTIAYTVGALACSVWLYVLAGLKEVSKVKRVMMNASMTAEHAPALQRAISSAPGVLDAIADAEAGAIYLKVNSDFDALQARSLISKLSAQ